MVVVITGASGFVGSYLIHDLRTASTEKDNIYGIANDEIIGQAAKELDGSALIDITDHDALRKYLVELKPDVIYHLAAQSSVAVSLKEPGKTFRVNVMGTLNLLEIAHKDLDTHPLILLIGSADVYKSPPDEQPITEETPFHPLNPYAASKTAVDYLGEICWKNYGLKTIRTRSFNHIGPGQATTFVMPSFARQIARIEKGLQDPVILVGNLNVKRDFTDVRDVVRAYRLLMKMGNPGDVYNVCSNRAVSIDSMLKMLMDLSTKTIEVRQDPERMRPADNPVLLGDNSKLVNLTGWKPAIPIEKTLEDLLNYWREKVDREYE